MTSKAPRLPSRAESLLADLPMPERDWEAQARAIDEKLASVDLGSTDTALLEAPELGTEPGEPASATPRPPSTSLADLARSVSPKSKREESNALFKQSLSVAAAARAQLPAATRAHATNAPTLQAPPSNAAPRRDAPKSALVPFLAGAGVAIAAAAVVALVMRTPAQTPAPVVVTPPAVAERVAAAPTQPAENEAAVPEAPGAESAPREREIEPSPSEMARTESEAERTAKRVPRAEPPAPTTAAAPAVPAARPPAPPKATSPKPERVVLDETEAPPAPTQPAESALRPASGASNTIPDQPSNGATQAALGSVLGAARACVAGMTGTSTASITFNSEGRVAKVSVSGPAAGTPAGACIQSALSRARVSPFTKPSFVVNGIAVRP